MPLRTVGNTLGLSVGQSSRLGLLYKLVFRPHSHLKVGTSFTEGWLPSLAGSPFPKGQGQHSHVTTLRVHNPPETHCCGRGYSLGREGGSRWNLKPCSGIKIYDRASPVTEVSSAYLGVGGVSRKVTQSVTPIRLITQRGLVHPRAAYRVQAFPTAVW